MVKNEEASAPNGSGVKNTGSDRGHAAVKLTVLCIVMYACSYLCRKSFDSNVNEIMAFYGQAKAAVGLIGTCFFVTYAVGQIFHGMMCKYYKPRPVMFIMAAAISALNVIMGVIPKTGFTALKYVWALNGLLSASLWSLLILTLHSCTASKYRPMIIFACTLPVTAGTFLVYGTSAIMSLIGNFRLTFYVSAAVFFAAALVWLFTSKSLIDRCKAERAELDGAEPDKSTSEKTNAGVVKEKFKIPASFYVTFAFLALFAIAHMIIRDGVNTWMPTILTERFHMANWTSVLLTTARPLVAFVGSFTMIRVDKKIKNYVLECGIVFALAGVFLLVLVLCGNAGGWLVTFLPLVIVYCMMCGINGLITAIYPMSVDKRINAGMVAGLVDGFCYVGSAISGYGIGAISDGSNGWGTVFVLFLVIALACAAFAFALTFIVKRKTAPTAVVPETAAADETLETSEGAAFAEANSESVASTEQSGGEEPPKSNGESAAE